MRKKITFVTLALGGIFALSSCGEEEVFVGESCSGKIDELNALSFPTGLTDADEWYPEYKNMEPETYTGEIKAEGSRKSGYYGYIDLGLSVKWATSNIGAVSPVTEQVTFEEILQTVEEEKKLESMEKPSFIYPAIMTYEEYLERKGEELSAYNKYSQYCAKKAEAHEEAVNRYNKAQYKNHEYLYYRGDKHPWGGLSMWDYLGTRTAPMNITGNAEFDAATYILGEGWSLPTKAQWQELIDMCTWEECTEGNHEHYYLVTGPSGKQIVLPINKYHTSEQTGTEFYYFYPGDTKEFGLGGFRELFYIRAVHTK